MTSREIFDMGIGGSGELQQIISILEACGNYCLIGGMALNCYCEPVYTADSDFAIASENQEKVRQAFKDAGMKVKVNRYDMSIFVPNSKLTIHITTDERYKDFGSRATQRLILDEISAKVASIEDLLQGKLWCYNDPYRKVSKKYKDRTDLARIGETFPELLGRLPAEIRNDIEQQAEFDRDNG